MPDATPLVSDATRDVAARILAEGAIGTAAAARYLGERGVRISSAGVWRWGGIRVVNGYEIALEHMFAGRCFYTSKAAIDRYLDALTKAKLAALAGRPGARGADPNPARGEASRARSIRAAEARLSRAGI